MNRLALLVWLFALPAARAGEREFPVDPVELLGGRTVPGDPDLAHSRPGYRYCFANPGNRAAPTGDESARAEPLGAGRVRMGVRRFDHPPLTSVTNASMSKLSTAPSPLMSARCGSQPGKSTV